MKSRKMVIAAATLAMIAAASVGPAMAYFTATDSASGTKYVDLGDSEITPDEKIDESGLVKTVTVRNTGRFDVWVRVKVFCPVDYVVNPGDNWEYKDGYYEYKKVVAQTDSEEGNETAPIIFAVELPEVTEDSQSDFNVIIVEEATRVTYDNDGNPEAPDWTLKADSTRVEIKTEKEDKNNEDNN